MAAPVGNRFWEARSSHGRDPIFAAPADLWKAACEYFEYTDEHPLWEAKGFAYQGCVTIEKFPKMRAMTLSGLCLFLDISRRTWDDYRERKDFILVCERIEQVIKDQKFAGAAADLLNPNIIARDLGLSEKQELAGAGGGPLEVTWKMPTEAKNG